MGKALNDYYQSYYKHPLNGYDSRYFDLPPKECRNCICYYCYNKLCPHCVGYRFSLAGSRCVKEKKIRSKDMIPHRCDKCYFLWDKKKPIYDCDFYVNFRRKRELYTLVCVHKKKSELEILIDKISKLEKLVEELYNSSSKK